MRYLMIGAFLFVQLVGFSDKVETVEVKDEKPVRDRKDDSVASSPFPLWSPLSGEVKPLSDCRDSAFASGAMGRGIFIEPTDGNLYAPCDGQVVMLFETLHAIGLKSHDGADVLIHIGINTVKLNGQGFKSHIKNGDKIKQGDLLIEFDISFIEQQGYNLATLVLITNEKAFADIVPHIGNVQMGDKILDVISKELP